ncbi:MAG TPA: hypothetical protein VFU92_08400 [Usitatibacter sp.]|nr:hypothetical protein [Usitatibacter sp.]
MLKNTTRKAGLAALCAFVAITGIARADDGGAEDYLIPAAMVTGGNDANGSDPVSCKEIRDAAWFNHELARSDGDVAPQGEEPYCKPDLFAESTVDAD